MAITVASIEGSVVRLIGGFYSAVGLTVTTAGANADLTDPILRGFLESTGQSPSDPSIVTDSDLSLVTTTPMLTFLVDVAAREALRTAMGKMTGVDTDVGDGSVKMSQLLISAKSLLSDLIRRTDASRLNQARAFVSTLTKGYPMPNDPLRPENWNYYEVTYP